jgi:hypothetical protein
MGDHGTSELSERDHEILASLARARVLTGGQLERLHAAILPPGTPKRTRRRLLTRLVQLGYVTTLDRRIGGVRAGSTGLIYTLDTAGQRHASTAGLTPPRRARRPRTPSPLFLAHTLDIAELYVQLVEATRTRGFQLVTFVTEPYTWQPTSTGRYLRPDGYTVLATLTHRDCWWLEVDRGTESLPRIRATCRAYHQHLTNGGHGPDGVPPRVLFTAPNHTRAHAIHNVITRLDGDGPVFLSVTTHDRAVNYLITELASP